jgi:bifunctional NMN adenylyltransferase/nudix hydrolase
MLKAKTYDVGVIVGRFQVPELHDAHKDLIKTVCDRHDKVIILLGLSPVRVTQENPLDFESRKQMILKSFPDVNVLYIKDTGTNESWSKQLDNIIDDLVTPAQSVVLYGGRDSFITAYTGRYPTQELVQETWVSGSEIRKDVSRKSVKASPEFRAGVVWAAYSQYPKCYATVDVAVFNEDESKILLCRKPHEDQYRLIGGFSMPDSDSYEADARREVQEEAGIAITDPVYVGSARIDDWRYRKEVDKIKTLLFRAKHMHGAPRPDDDVAEVRWFDVGTINLKQIRPEHHVLINMLFN